MAGCNGNLLLTRKPVECTKIWSTFSYVYIHVYILHTHKYIQACMFAYIHTLIHTYLHGNVGNVASHKDNTNGSFEYIFIACLWMKVRTGYTLAYTKSCPWGMALRLSTHDCIIHFAIYAIDGYVHYRWLKWI